MDGIEVKYSTSAALAKAHARYEARNPKSKQLHFRSSEHLPGGNTRTVIYSQPFPLVFTSGDGPHLQSVDGQVYTDFLNEYSAGIYGHSNPQIREAILQSLTTGWNYGGHNQNEKILAAKILQRFGEGGIDLVRFTNSGTEANTMAIAVATQMTRRKKVLVFTGGYHGATLIFPKEPSNAMTANLPDDWVLAPYNNMEETMKIVDNLPPQSLAAVLIEPVQGSGGCRPASREFLSYLRDIADRLGAIFIADEVMTSRLGPHGFLATTGLRADLMTLGKYVAGGMTFGAFGGRRDIMELFNPANGPMAHAGTFNNNVLSMAAGIVGLGIYSEQEVDALKALGNSLRQILLTMLAETGVCPKSAIAGSQDILEMGSFEGPTMLLKSGEGLDGELPKMFVTGHGSMINVRFSGTDSGLWNALFFHHMLENNIYIATRGYITSQRPIYRSLPPHLSLLLLYTRKNWSRKFQCYLDSIHGSFKRFSH
ncbi:putative acetylornithine aminotransferase [Trichoderma ceciliae]